MPEREEERSGIFDVKKKSNKQSNRQKKNLSLLTLQSYFQSEFYAIPEIRYFFV